MILNPKSHFKYYCRPPGHTVLKKKSDNTATEDHQVTRWSDQNIYSLIGKWPLRVCVHVDLIMRILGQVGISFLACLCTLGQGRKMR